MQNEIKTVADLKRVLADLPDETFVQFNSGTYYVNKIELVRSLVPTASPATLKITLYNTSQFDR